MFISYPVNNNDIWCDEKFVNVKIRNTFGLTTKDVESRPLVDKRTTPYDKCVGHLVEADKDYIYGIVYSPSVLYDNDVKFSTEVKVDSAKIRYKTKN